MSRALIAAFAVLLCAPAAQAADEVKLVHATSSQCPPTSGCYKTPYLRGTLEVKNLAYEKTITVHYYSWSTGAWHTAPASYVEPTSSDKELWSFDISTAGATRFALAYTVNGTTWWDNNGGQDYRLADYEFDALLTWPDISGATGQRDTSASAVVGHILVKNRSYQKTVRVVYTDDNWATTKQASASYVATLPSGVEYWSFEAPVSAAAPESAIRLAFEYTHDHGTAWDNNFGHDYRVVSGVLSR